MEEWKLNCHFKNVQEDTKYPLHVVLLSCILSPVGSFSFAFLSQHVSSPKNVKILNCFHSFNFQKGEDFCSSLFIALLEIHAFRMRQLLL